MNSQEVRDYVNPKLDKTIDRIQTLLDIADSESEAEYQREYDRLISRVDTLMEVRRELLAITLTEEGRAL